MRSVESERLFEEIQENVLKYEDSGFEGVVMGDFNAHIGLGSEEAPNRNGHRLLHLVEAARMSIGNLSSVCSGRWTWESRGLRSVVDYFLMAGNVVLKRMEVEEKEDLG